MTYHLSDYDYEYPPHAVAQHPLEDRSASRMMVYSVPEKRREHRHFRELSEYLRPGDLLVVNETAVRPSRVYAKKPTGGRVEVFLLKPLGNLCWEVFLSPARGLLGAELALFSRATGEELPRAIKVIASGESGFQIRFISEELQTTALERFAEVPLPPYIERDRPLTQDERSYQTVYARVAGAVAAPTAGLHFTEEVRQSLLQRGVEWASLVLHVGAGTFLPVKTEDVRDHVMHEEYYEIPPETIAALEACRRRGGRVLAVGTTTLRALETYGKTGNCYGASSLFILPGFTFSWVDALLTNFHQPRSTLMMLVSALAGREEILEAYREAIAQGYRLFSYGDCMLIIRGVSETPAIITG